MFGLSKPLIAGLVGLALAVAFAGIIYLGIREVRLMITDAATAAKTAADAQWQAKIEKSNVEANRKIADQATATPKIQADAADAVNAASQQLEELRKRNAELPHGTDIGLSADRARLLPD